MLDKSEFIPISTDVIVEKRDVNARGYATLNGNVSKRELNFTAEPHGCPFDVYAAYTLRLTAFANGAILVIKHLMPDNQALIKSIKEALEKKITEINLYITDPNKKSLKKGTLNTELDHFIQKLTTISGLNKKQIAAGEAFWAWQYYDRPNVHETTYKRADLTIIQRDTLLLSRLTIDQRRDLVRIHTNEPPNWFKKLDSWAQAFLRTIVPEKASRSATDTAWMNYERCIPATLRNIPGQANATRHELIIKNARGEIISSSQAVRQGVPTAFGMSRDELQTSAKENLAQMLNDVTRDATTDFMAFWGVTELPSEIQCPVLLGGLLTPKDQGGYGTYYADTFGVSAKENNTQFVQDKTEALDAYKKANSDQNLWFINLNVAINYWRNEVPVQLDGDFIARANKIKAYFLIQNSKKPESAERAQFYINKISPLTQAIAQLKANDGAIDRKDRNKNLYTAALYDVTTRLMGGCSTGNCKSSKDRKGVELIMADAMMIYYNLYGAFPAYDEPDNNSERLNFIDIFVDVYNSGHQLLIAHDNSPGSAGIKDEGFLDDDFISALNDKNHSYAQSKELANFNKPGTFFQKHNKKIMNGLAIFAVIAILSIGLSLATGGLAPAALLTGTIALKLGPMGAWLGSIAAAVIYPLVAAAVIYATIKTTKDASRNTISAQYKAGPEVSSVATDGPSSTARIQAMPQTKKATSNAQGVLTDAAVPVSKPESKTEDKNENKNKNESESESESENATIPPSASI